MRKILVPVLFLLFATLVNAGGDNKADLKMMEGTWKAVMEEADGKPAGEAEKGAPFKLVVKDGKFTVYFDDKKLTAGAIKLDAAKKPKEIDAEQGEGPFKGMVQKGLYEFKGTEMRVIFAEPGKDRPTTFKTREGEVLLHYARFVEKKK